MCFACHFIPNFSPTRFFIYMYRSAFQLTFTLFCILLALTQCKPKQAVSSGQESSFRNIPREAKNAATVSTAPDTADYFDRDYLRNIDYTYADNIRTVLLHPLDAPLSPPQLFLGDGKQLRLSFDDLEGGHKEFTYRVVHCNAGWQPSELTPPEYINGFTTALISNSDLSENTHMEYTHYYYDLPNRDFKLTKSGNYLVHVLYGDKVILTKRFIIVENRLGISPVLKEPDLIKDRSYMQELDFTITHPAYEIIDPYKSLKVVLMQNNRWDAANYGIQPNFVKNAELVYDYDEINVFEGGNEYRAVDLKSLQFKPFMIADLEVGKDNYYHAYLMDDEPRSYLRYSTTEDINGKFLIKKDDAVNSAIEADYVYVHFSLPYSLPETTGDIYIYGQLSNWQLQDDFKMTYDYEKKRYTRTLLLKQGYYNYNYVFLEDRKKVGEMAVVEGTHFETENDYTIYVYYREPGENYDRCVGVKNLNSIKKN